MCSSDLEEGIQLKNPQKEIPKMFKHLSEEVPEEAHVGREIRDLQTEEKNSNNQSVSQFLFKGLETVKSISLATV